MRDFTGPLRILTVACLFGAATGAWAQDDSASAWYQRGLEHRQKKNCRAAVADFSRALELQPDYFSALYQRGNCLETVGEHALAIEDYSRAIAVPGRVHDRFRAYYARADARRRLGELDLAADDYTRVMELRADTAALRSRAWVNFYRGRWRDAYADAEKYVHDTEAKEADAAYLVILGTLAMRRAGLPEQGARFLQSWRRKLDAKRWPAPVLNYLESADERALLSAAKTPGERTEARAYQGVNLITQGAQARGVEVLREVLRDGEPAYFEYDLAYHELRRLGIAKPEDRRHR